MQTTIFGALAAVMLILYVVRRRKRLAAEE